MHDASRRAPAHPTLFSNREAYEEAEVGVGSLPPSSGWKPVGTLVGSGNQRAALSELSTKVITLRKDPSILSVTLRLRLLQVLHHYSFPWALSSSPVQVSCPLMRPDTQLSDEMATVSETAYPIEASRRLISGRTLPEPAEATAIFTLEPRTRRSRKVWALLTSEVRGCPFAAAQGGACGANYYRLQVGPRKLGQ